MIIDDALIKKAEICIEKLMKKGLHVFFAESCTGGLLAYLFSTIPGASRVFEGSAVTYSDKAKTSFLGITQTQINMFGVVSKNIAVLMAEGILKNYPSVDIAISITGIAGRRTTENTENNEKNTGTVFIGRASKKQPTKVVHLSFGDMARWKIQHKAVEAAMDLII